MRGESNPDDTTTTAFILDVVALGGVGTVIAAIYFLVPLDVQTALALDHGNPRPWSFWTAAFVHDHRPGHGHLTMNLTGYAVAAGYTWYLYATVGMRSAFWRASALLLVPGAIVVNAASFVVYRIHPAFSIEYGRGFSGVVGGFDGLLIASLLSFWAVLIAAGVQNREAFAVEEWATHNLVLVALALLGTAAATLLFGGLLLQGISTTGDGFVDIVGHGAGIVVGLVVGHRFADFSQILPDDVDVS